MFKKISIFLMAALLALTLVSCTGGSGGTDTQLDAASVDFVKFIKDNAKSMTLGNDINAYTSADKYINSYEAYIDTIKEDIPLSDDVVDYYVDSFAAYFEESMSDSDLKAEAESMIYREMAVRKAYAQLGGKSVDTDDADLIKNAAKEMAEEYGVNVDAVYTDGGSTYVVETYIMYKYVVDYFENGAAETSEPVESTEEVSVEESVEEESTEESTEESAE